MRFIIEFNLRGHPYTTWSYFQTTSVETLSELHETHVMDWIIENLFLLYSKIKIWATNRMQNQNPTWKLKTFQELIRVSISSIFSSQKRLVFTNIFISMNLKFAHFASHRGSHFNVAMFCHYTMSRRWNTSILQVIWTYSDQICKENWMKSSALEHRQNICMAYLET